MRRLRPIRRRERERQREQEIEQELEAALASEDESEEEQDEFLPFVPVTPSVETYGDDAENGESAYAAAPLPARRRMRLPHPHLPTVRVGRPRLGVGLRPGLLLAALLLIAAGVFGTLVNLDRISQPVEEWWPAVLIGVAALWMIAALLRRQITAFLGGAAFAGVGLSLLLDTQQIAALQDTLLGVVLVTLGLGIAIRGFLLRQQTPF